VAGPRPPSDYTRAPRCGTVGALAEAVIAASRTRTPMLALFFLANALATGALIVALGVRAPAYQAIPWIFVVAFAASCPRRWRERMTSGPAGWRLVPVLLYAGVITLASSVNPSPSVAVPGNAFHPVEFAGQAFVAQLAANGGLMRRPGLGRAARVALGCLAVAVLDEVHQSFVPARNADGWDVARDALGIALGTLVLLGVAAVMRRRAPTSNKPPLDQPTRDRPPCPRSG